MTQPDIARARLRNSGLVGERRTSAAEAVRWFGAVQAQDVPGALWALAQRMAPGKTIHELGADMDAGRIIRVHALRPTWHFIAPADLRWVQALTGERVHRSNRTINRRIGVTEDDYRRVEPAIRQALAGGRAMTRAELREVMATAGIDTDVQLVVTYLGMRAELESLICQGPRRGKQATYQLVDERVPTTPPRDRADALCDLTIRYFQSHGPATPHDMSWWSGLTVGDVRHGIELAGHALETQTVGGRPYWAAAGGFEPAELPRPHILLISNYDEVIGSYADYSPVVEASMSPPNWVHDAVGPHVILRDGLVVGGWRRGLDAKRVTVSATLFVDLSPAEVEALRRQAEELGRFFGLPAELRQATR